MAQLSEQQRNEILEVALKFAWKLIYPVGKSRVEKLMGSNLVSLTDRNYMQKLQRRIVEDYTENMSKRISSRQAKELERVKNLVLVGKIPLEKAPIEMANHPVMLIEKYFNPKEFSTKKDSKTKRLKLTNRSSSIETLPILESTHCEKIDALSPIENNLGEDTDEEEAHFGTEGIELVKYENPLIKELKNCETVHEMYALADEIIGKIKTEHRKPDEILQHSDKNL
nr:uncharacterized protein LOC111422698 [Onthophagus taurus]